MDMNNQNFTPSEIKYVAETTMPQKGEQAWMVWPINTGSFDGGYVATSERYLKTKYDPEANDTQFRALVEWCMDNGVKIIKTDKYRFSKTRPNLHFGQNAYDTHTDCMIAAVLAKRGGSDG